MRAILQSVLVASCVATSTIRAQDSLASVPLPGSEADASLRFAQLLGAEPATGYLLRSVGTRLAPRGSTAQDVAVRVFLPELGTQYNSAHAWGGNDGPLRSGRGLNAMLSAGVALDWWRFSAVLVPQFVREANLDVQTFPYPQPTPPVRNVWANPFYPFPSSLDYPQRFGDQSRTQLSVQGRVAAQITPWLRTGLSNENRWWGPSVRNGLLLTANAPGFGHVFLETPAPITTRVGHFEYQYLLGTLRESEFFDYASDNDARALSAFAVTWRAPDALADWPTVGIARAVLSNGGPSVDDVLAFARNVGRPWSNNADTIFAREQIFIAFARWLIPRAGVETYVEWAKFEQPANLRELLVAPGHMQGYTLGAALARPWRGGALHVQTEWSYMEPSASVRVRPVGTTYTSRTIAQSWTHRGQMLGPAIGPGGSSQWAAVDARFPTWRAGGSLGRVRRDPNYRYLNPIPSKRDDVSLYATLRGGIRIGPMDALLEFSEGVRLNYLYQAFPDDSSPSGESTGIDLVNRTLSLTLTPHRRLRTTPR
jgi:hypothetical protein